MTADEKAAAHLVDAIAEKLHDVWWQLCIDRGTRLGPRELGSPYHPHLIPWSAKTEQERMQDRYQAIRVMLMYRDNPSATEEQIADEIHRAVRDFRWATGSGPLPSHLKSDWRDNSVAAEERRKQATAIRPLLQDFRWGLETV